MTGRTSADVPELHVDRLVLVLHDVDDPGVLARAALPQARPDVPVLPNVVPVQDAAHQRDVIGHQGGTPPVGERLVSHTRETTAPRGRPASCRGGD
jgi:hypothetical protein